MYNLYVQNMWMQSHPSRQSKLGSCAVPWGHGLTIIYCSYAISPPMICSDPVFLSKHFILDALKIEWGKKVSLCCTLVAVSLMMDYYYSFFNNGILSPWIVSLVTLLKFFLRTCLNIWWHLFFSKNDLHAIQERE